MGFNVATWPANVNYAPCQITRKSSTRRGCRSRNTFLVRILRKAIEAPVLIEVVWVLSAYYQRRYRESNAFPLYRGRHSLSSSPFTPASEVPMSPLEVSRSERIF